MKDQTKLKQESEKEEKVDFTDLNWIFKNYFSIIEEGEIKGCPKERRTNEGGAQVNPI